ncbi:MAG TPA: hypothetical protein VH085_00165 [Nocardioides sp.]|nr:hypothetical protein [Nocardioides sp.]
MPPIPTTLPHGRTARRLEWAHLPPTVRRLVEERCGASVVSAESQGGGFTPGFASVLTCDDGSRHFVKAASTAAQRMFAASYREEARKLRALPDSVPAPRLLWSVDDDWVVLGLEYVEATAPQRPWRGDELDRCLDALELVADQLTPVPDELQLDPIEDEFAGWPAYWGELRGRDDRPHADEAAALAATYAEVVGGQTLVHTDVRDDNLLLTADGRALICDWNWPASGAAWLDSLILLIGPRGDGVDVDAVIATRPLLRDVPADHVDRVLALVCGYFLKCADDPVPATSPYLREAQRWQGEVVWDWLAERRGWQ